MFMIEHLDTWVRATIGGDIVEIYCTNLVINLLPSYGAKYVIIIVI